MMPPNDSGFYEVARLGELYDVIPVYKGRPDVSFYVDAAVQSGGPVLEVGCGTGRVLLPTAREGLSITGIDSSRVMLDRCRGRLAAESEETRRRVTLHQQDMRTLDIGETFALATIPFRPFQHLLSVDDQIAALSSIHRHLDPSGRLVFDVFNPNLAALVMGPRPEHEDTPPTPMPDGKTLRRTGQVNAVHITQQISEVEMIYYVTEPDGNTERVVHAFSMRWYTPFEVEHLLARCGFALKTIYGNFDKSVLADDSPEMIFVAERI